MKFWSNKYLLIINAIALVVAFLTHSPEIIALSNTSAEGMIFPDMHWTDVGSEVCFTYLSLCLLSS